MLADVFVLYVKTKGFHWHISGPHFRDYHLLLDEHAEELIAMTDEIAERARKIGGTSLRSIADIARHQRPQDSEAPSMPAESMFTELRSDNQVLISLLLRSHDVCEGHGDVGTASLIENWVDAAQRRHWFLSAMTAD